MIRITTAALAFMIAGCGQSVDENALKTRAVDLVAQELAETGAPRFNLMTVVRPASYEGTKALRVCGSVKSRTRGHSVRFVYVDTVPPSVDLALDGARLARIDRLCNKAP